MNTFSLTLENGSVYAFELDNVYIRPRKIASLLSSVEGVSDIEVRRSFSSSNDTHVKFRYHDKNLIVWEPYGDNSRYWVGPEKENEEVNMTALENVFKQYKLPFIVKLLGDLVSLNFRAILKW